MKIWHFQALRKAIDLFRRDRQGNIAVIFSLALIPLIGFIGASVDYSRAASLKTALQSALDATALMVSKSAATQTPAQVQTAAQGFFNALFDRPEANNTVIAASYSSSAGSSVTVTGTSNLKTDFMKVMGFKNLTINSTSTVKWGNTKLRVALVLDNTGSMASAGKMTALKTATKNLLAQLKAAATNNGDVYVSIIPFSKDVNVDASNYNANWIDWTDWEDDNGHDTSTQTCTTKTGKNGKKTKKCTTSTTWVPDNHNTWNGCITDRDQNYDQTVEPATGSASANPSKLYPAEEFDSCPLAMMGLNYNWTSMNSLVDQMYSDGNTNQPIGLVWGWLSLVGGGPLSVPAKLPNYQYQDVIVLMSDGLNTENRWSTSQTQIDKRMYDPATGLGTCANIKAAGVTIYTVHVNTDGDPQSTLLQNCASSSDKFWMVTSANGIGTVFAQIGTQLSNLHISN